MFAFVNHRKKKHRLGVLSGAEDEVMSDEIGNVNNADGVKQESTAPDGVKKVFFVMPCLDSANEMNENCFLLFNG